MIYHLAKLDTSSQLIRYIWYHAFLNIRQSTVLVEKENKTFATISEVIVTAI